MVTRLTLDKAGRVVLPKPLRDRFATRSRRHPRSGNRRRAHHSASRPPEGLLKKELGVWVYQGEPTDASIPDLIDRDRENRNRAITESVIK